MADSGNATSTSDVHLPEITNVEPDVEKDAVQNDTFDEINEEQSALQEAQASSSIEIIRNVERKTPVSVLLVPPNQITEDERRFSKTSKTSKISKTSKAGKKSKGNKDSKSNIAMGANKESKHSKAKRAHKKNAIQQKDSRSSSVSRQSETSVRSKSSIQRTSSLLKSTRVSSMSLDMSADSSLDMWPMLRKSRLTSSLIGDDQEKVKSTYFLHTDEENVSSFSVIQDIDEEEQVTDMESMQSIETIETIEPIVERSKMLEILREIPDINEISIERLTPVKKPEDAGRIVLPVSSTTESSDSESESESLPYESGTESIKFDADANISISRSLSNESNDTLLNLTSLSPQDSVSTLQFTLDTSESQADIIAKQMAEIRIRGSLTEYIDAGDREGRKIARRMCLQFVQEMIERVVSECEKEPARLVRWLDKGKVWGELCSMLEQLNDESAIRDKLQKLITEHFLRKKRYVFIKPETKLDDMNYQRFKCALVEYDRQLEIEEKTNQKVEEHVKDLKNELGNEQEYSDVKQLQLENTVRYTLIRNEFVHLEDILKNVFKRMTAIRDEISGIRLELLFSQHRFADIKAKLESLEDIGDGLKMHDYISRQADIQVLLYKIQERDGEIARLHMKVNFDVHALGHLKGKKHMSRRTYNRMKTHLQNCIRWQNYYRAEIYQGKLKHNAIVREITRLKTDGGLLNYPILLMDFENTEAELRSKRESIEKLRHTFNLLTQRISAVEFMLERARKSNRSSRSSGKLSLFSGSLKVTQLKLS